jgi:hypothetical protein
MGKADIFSLKASPKDKGVNVALAALEAARFKGYHNKKKVPGGVEYYFDHRRERKLSATLAVEDNSNLLTVTVLDRA